ncbi:MAG: hypothetical protein ABI409_18920, partial [Ramlibacter sp.]
TSCLVFLNFHSRVPDFGKLTGSARARVLCRSNEAQTSGTRAGDDMAEIEQARRAWPVAELDGRFAAV